MEESKQFDSHFEEISSKKHSDGTKQAYAKKVNVFKRWIKSTYPECIDNNEECLILSEITSDIIKQFFDHVVKYKGGSKNDQLKSFSTPEGYRSALVNMYKSVNVSLPEIFGNELKDYFKGYRNEIATKKLNGEMKAIEGKDGFSHTQYKTLCEIAFRSNSYMKHLFLVISWNLMTRSKSTSNIHLDHLKWIDDCIVFNIPKDKSHLAGEENGLNKKHVYSNPVDPFQCPVLSLGIALICNSTMNTNRVLFNHQLMEENFSNWLKKILQSADYKDVASELEKYLDSNNYSQISAELRDEMFKNAMEKMKENLFNNKTINLKTNKKTKVGN
jgi:hypothetical protein